MSRPGASVTLSLSPKAKANLEKIALQFGMTWGERPNISALMAAIAEGKLKVDWAEDLDPESKAAEVAKAIANLKDSLDGLSRVLR